jgi:hypothetical protein
MEHKRISTNCLKLSIAFFVAFSLTNAHAQGLIKSTASAEDTQRVASRAANSKLNVVKLNVSSLAIDNIHVTYERALSHRFAVALGVRYMPQGDLPFEKSFKKQVKSDQVNFDLFKMGNVAVTPECRLYLGKGYLHGFYISAYGRYSKFNITAPIQFTSKSNGTTENVLFKGDVTAYSGGIMFGMQYTLWKIIVLDIMLIGGNFGSCTGTINADNITPALSAQDQQSLQQNIDDINAKPYKVSGKVQSSTQAYINVSGPWAGIRSGINIGVRF